MALAFADAPRVNSGNVGAPFARRFPATAVCLVALAGTTTTAALPQVSTFAGTRTVREILDPVMLLSPTVAALAIPEADDALVHWVKDTSGLTWDQLGRVFGVSRRSVHLWATGSKISAAKAELLREFARDVAALAGANPTETRAALLATRHAGLSTVDQYRARAASGTRVSGTAFRADALLG